MVPSPNPSNGYNILSSLAAVSPTDVWAVGYYCTSLCTYSTPQTLIEQWNGSTWDGWPSITVQGTVSCTSHPLVGVWVQSSSGGSRFAEWSKSSSNGYDGIFSTKISTALPTTLQLHVGCGGSTSSWWSDNWTPGKSVNRSVTLEASCNEGTNKPAKGSNSRCAFTTTSVESAAVNWAKSYLNKNVDSGKCLTFVFDAYSAAGINLRQWVNISITSTTYPQDIWNGNHFTHGLTGTGTPPAGALVFFNATSGHDHTFSHVELSVGGGNMISTADTVNENYVHYETLAQHAASGAYNTYVGWWLPA